MNFKVDFAFNLCFPKSKNFPQTPHILKKGTKVLYFRAFFKACEKAYLWWCECNKSGSQSIQQSHKT